MLKRHAFPGGLVLTVTLLLLSHAIATAQEESSLKWTVKALCVDSNEGCAVADLNQDGKPDIIAGRNWYAAPDFVARPVRTIEDWNGYVESNGDFAYDVDKDGLTDVVAGSFIPTEVYWYRNPGVDALKQGKMFEKNLLVDTETSTNEGQMMCDLNGDGVPEWIVNAWRKDVPMQVWRFTQEEREVTVKRGNKEVTETKTVPALAKVVIGETANGHGLAIGDLNGDGHTDLLVGQGWYENPGDQQLEGNWPFHADWDLHASIPMILRDLDGDGLSDLIVGDSHNYGLHWWRQLPDKQDGKLAWEEHLIDDEWSQPHCLVMADLDGDGQDELITGKRVFAHNGRDPGGQEAPCLYYYTWNGDKLTFTRHTIEEGRVGSGLQIRPADLNGDGRMDIAVAGKSGTYVLINEGR